MGKSGFLKEMKRLDKKKVQGYNIHDVITETIINPHQVTYIHMGVKGIKSLSNAHEYFYAKYGRGAVIFVPLVDNMLRVGFVKSSDFREDQNVSLSLVEGYNLVSEIVASVDPRLSIPLEDEPGSFEVSLTILKQKEAYCTQKVINS